jgi:hypothetical protein
VAKSYRVRLDGSVHVHRDAPPPLVRRSLSKRLRRLLRPIQARAAKVLEALDGR